MKKQLFLLLFVSSSVLAQQEYGQADFSRHDAWSKDRLVEYWRLDPGTQGDSTNGSGDFESWQGSHASCTDCPTGWTCQCDGVGDDIDDETTEIQKHDTSATTTVTNSYIALEFTHTFVANTCYQITFWVLGDAGGEDPEIYITDAALGGESEYYAFATDTWGAGAASIEYTNITTTWTRVSAWVSTGAVAKTNYIVSLVNQNAGQTVYFDNFQLQRLNGCSVTGQRGNQVTSGAITDQIFGMSLDVQGRVGTGPAGSWSTIYDGVDDSLDRADDDTFDIPDDFSVASRAYTTDITAGWRTLASKYTGASHNWWYGLLSDDWRFFVSSDGTGVSETILPQLNIAIDDALFSNVCTYDWITNGGSLMTADTNFNAQASDATSVGPPWNSTQGLSIGSQNGTAVEWLGTIQDFAFWDKTLNSIEIAKWMAPHFPANNHGDGMYVTACTQATAHAVCSHQRCREGTPNGCYAEGTGVLSAFEGATDNIDNNSFETFAGADSVANFTNLTEVEVAGDGTANITAYRDDMYHGSVSARLARTGTTSQAAIVTECLTAGVGDLVYVSAAAKKLTGVANQGQANFSIYINEYDTAACGTDLGLTAIVTETNIDPEWRVYGGLIDTWNGSTSSYTLLFVQDTSATGSDILLDRIGMVDGIPFFSPWVHVASGAGSVTYSSRIYNVHNVLGDYSPIEDGFAYASGYCVSAWVYSDWAADLGGDFYIISVPGTAGNNNRMRLLVDTNDDLRWDVYDSAGAVMSKTLAGTTTNWPAEGWKYVEACTNNDGTTAARHYNVANSTWYAWSNAAGAGTGVQNGQNATMGILSDTVGNIFYGYTSRIFISPYNVVWTNAGFNNGRPPLNGNRPY
jgi:hypothetical protein